ncbi:high mobility group nucleosome-binding domain-containing protein 5-like [Cynara cardunculus var. scolymus]|uniref:high mobility group nucleosome-binding domain-containing protein 5-like n=1 Tax=Cynara cardunculus var. scolymus TaxID=59895 RepID=UPI000D623FAD|nr:high mobility group nucleosome-binding domain-containing protein 5-like [Cynara cardunculus var. scolymus]
MFRQSPRSRNGRNKGLKIKHVLQMSALFGASIWLLYQVQHTDNKKPPVTTNISKNLHKDSSNDMIKLGRKGLHPRGKETNVQDKKETIEHEADEEDNEKEAEELVQGHESEDMKHDEVGENASTDDGTEKNTKTGYEELKVDMEGHQNEEAKEKEDGINNEKIKTEGMKQTHNVGNGSKNEEAAKEVNGSKKSREGNMNIPTQENSNESTQESKNEENGRKAEVKEEKEDDNQMQPNPNEVVEIASPPEEDDGRAREENLSSEEVNDNRSRKENGEKREENGSSNKGPSVNESQLGSNPSHSKSNEDDKDSSSNRAKASEEETSTTSSTKFVKNRKIGNLSRQRMWIKSVKKNTSPDSSLVPSFEPKKNEGK